jgi:hypothetical protein
VTVAISKQQNEVLAEKLVPGLFFHVAYPSCTPRAKGTEGAWSCSRDTESNDSLS